MLPAELIKAKTIRTLHIIIICITLTLALVGTSVSLLYGNWRASYITIYQEMPDYNIIKFELNAFADRFVNSFFASKKMGLPQVRLYIPQKARTNLLVELPANIKKWQKGHMLFADGKIRKVKVRHRGDNPLNWGWDKKSWRVKVRKKNLIDGTRTFNYIVPQQADFINNHLAYMTSNLIGINAVKSRNVELYINDRSYGIYMESEQLDESFLRQNKIMPVNIYKGEQANSERKIFISNKLFDNPSLWSKTATFNQLPEDDVSDLENFLNLLRASETDGASFVKLKEIAPYKDWARFAAFQTIVQSWVNDHGHNMRLISDPWKGTIVPVPHDTRTGYGFDEPFHIDQASHSLFRRYHQEPEFLLEKYKLLKGFVDGQIFKKIRDEIDQIEGPLFTSLSRDRFSAILQVITRNDQAGTASETARAFANTKAVLSRLEKFIHDKLDGEPDVHWFQSADLDTLNLLVSDVLPVDKLTLEFESNGSPLPSLYLDVDSNGTLSEQDTLLPTTLIDGKINIEATWFANRLSIKDGLVPYSLTSVDIRTQPTQFRIFVTTPAKIVNISASNPLNNRAFEVENRQSVGATPSERNHPILRDVVPTKRTWSGDVTFSGVNYFDRPVEIEAGTTIHMKPGSSLIFRNSVNVLGVAEFPVKVIPQNPDMPWGTFALLGRKAAGSRISHLNMTGGSGLIGTNIRFTSMLSVHDTKNIIFNNLVLRDSQIFDDMFHIVYSSDIEINNCDLRSAFSDAIDIDISKVKIKNCKITNSGNDALDIMSSNIAILDSTLEGSGDKGMSVGEDSRLLAVGVHVKGNEVGIAVKDKSTARVLNSNLIENVVDISSFAKNWRYGGGGNAIIEKSYIASQHMVISKDKKSEIHITDSAIVSPNQQARTNSFSGLENDTIDMRRTKLDNFLPDNQAALEFWGIEGNQSLRGAP